MARVQITQIETGDLPEPKGIGTATSGQVYLSDGSGGGAWVNEGSTQNSFTAADETKLDGIETGAQVNVANTVVDANYVATDQNFTKADHTKLDGIAAGAQVNATNTVVDANYVATDQNFTDADHTKLDGIEAGAQVNIASATPAQGALADTALQPVDHDKGIVLNRGSADGDLWQRVATVNRGNGHRHLSYQIGNTLSDRGVQVGSIMITGRDSDNGDIAVGGWFNVSENDIGIRIIKTTNMTGSFTEFDVYFKTVNLTSVTITAAVMGAVTWYDAETPISVQPTDVLVELDTTTHNAGQFTIIDSVVAEVFHDQSYQPSVSLGVGVVRIMKNLSGGTILNGADIAGSSLAAMFFNAGGTIAASGAAVPGTWRNVGGASCFINITREFARIA